MRCNNDTALPIRRDAVWHGPCSLPSHRDRAKATDTEPNRQRRKRIMTNSRLLPALWASFDRFSGEMDRWLENVGVGAPALNVWEDAEAFHVEAEVPGLTQDQLQVAVTHKTQLLIQGEQKPQE